MNRVAVWVYRHPDSSNEIVVSAPEGFEVLVVSQDDGSSYDGHPRDKEEAEIALENVNARRDEVASLPQDDPVRSAAEEWAEGMTEYIARYLSAARIDDIMHGTFA